MPLRRKGEVKTRSQRQGCRPQVLQTRGRREIVRKRKARLTKGREKKGRRIKKSRETLMQLAPHHLIGVLG